MRLEDAYRLLDLDPAASDAAVKSAYRDLSKVWHPDRFGHDPSLRARAEEKLKAINEAHEAIRASRERASADPLGDDEPVPDEPLDPGWRVRWRGREIRVDDLAAVEALLDRGTVGEGAEVYDPAARCWAVVGWIPELRQAVSRIQARRFRTRALVSAGLAFLVLRMFRSPAFLVIALGLFGLSIWYVARMLAAGKAGSGPG